MSVTGLSLCAAASWADSAGGGGFDVGRVLVAGLLATVVLTTLMELAQGLRWSRISLPLIVGTIFTSGRERALVMGTAVHFATGTLSAFLYAAFFEIWSWPGWWFGSVLGFVHGLFILAVVLPTMPGMHPLMADERRGPTPTRGLQPPGFLCLNYGWGSTLSALGAHLAYGTVFGLLYVSS